jgi:hypothetical protein
MGVGMLRGNDRRLESQRSLPWALQDEGRTNMLFGP